MHVRIDTIPEKKLIGMRISTSFLKDRTRELWKSFMPRRNEIKNAIGTDLYSLQIYPADHFTNFNPADNFEKLAAVEVADFNEIPADMSSFTLPGGRCAVFLHKGPASEGPRSFRHIFHEWFPASGYALDNRPHFEILDDKYKNEDPGSEEEIWIPIKTV